MDAARRGRGHAMLPHTADVIVEAWGDDLPSCIEEAVAGLTDIYAATQAAIEADRVRAHVQPGPSDSQLLCVLQEMIFLLDTSAHVPVSAQVTVADDGSLEVVIVLAERDTIEATGAVPKAISRSELAVETSATGARCRYLVDV